MIRKTKESLRTKISSGFQFNNDVIKMIKKISNNKAHYTEVKPMLTKLKFVSDQIIIMITNELKNK